MGVVKSGVVKSAAAKATIRTTTKLNYRIKSNRRIIKRRAFERKVEHSIDYDSGRPTIEDRTYDRQRDLYTKRIIYSDTGDVKIDEKKKLSEHKNRGSAKK